jgi:pyridoxamine 5'-phosphate oxidase
MRKSEMDPDPIKQFEKWFNEAQASGIIAPEAMALATATPEGRPSVRMILLKGIRKGGFEFYTNLESRKGRELESNPRASILFWWNPLRWQVRVEGIIEKIDSEEADAYFQTRPRGSQIGAWASPQSRPIPDRLELERRVQAYEGKFSNKVARPPFWG